MSMLLTVAKGRRSFISTTATMTDCVTDKVVIDTWFSPLFDASKSIPVIDQKYSQFSKIDIIILSHEIFNWLKEWFHKNYLPASIFFCIFECSYNHFESIFASSPWVGLILERYKIGQCENDAIVSNTCWGFRTRYFCLQWKYWCWFKYYPMRHITWTRNEIAIIRNCK